MYTPSGPDIARELGAFVAAQHAQGRLDRSRVEQNTAT
jgi:hypothetical protein